MSSPPYLLAHYLSDNGGRLTPFLPPTLLLSRPSTQNPQEQELTKSFKATDILSLKKSTSKSSQREAATTKSISASQSTPTTSIAKKEKQKEADKEREEQTVEAAVKDQHEGDEDGEQEEEERDEEEEEEKEEEFGEEPGGRKGRRGQEGEGGTSTILEEVALLWGMVKDRPFAESKFTQLALDRYVFCRELPSLTEDKMNMGVERMVLLLREAAHIAPQMACHRILVTYKRKMSQALRRDREGYWLQDPVYKNSEAGRLVGLAAGVVLRLCEEKDYGAYFVELILDELLQQLYKPAKGEVAEGGKEGGDGGIEEEKEEEEKEQDEEEEEKQEEDKEQKEGKEDGDISGGHRQGRKSQTETDHEREREKEFAFRRQRDGFAAAALFTCLCKELRLLQRVRALVYDIFLLNGKLASLGPLAAFFHLWPAVLGEKEGVMARALLVCFHEAYKHQRDTLKGGSSSSSGSRKLPSSSSSSSAAAAVPMTLAVADSTATAATDIASAAATCGVDGETEAKAWVAEMAYEGFSRYVMGRERKNKDADDDGVEAPEELAEEFKAKLLLMDEDEDDEVEEEEVEEKGKKAKKEAETEELVRALVLLASVQSLQWMEANVLQEYATGELTTPPGMMRLLAGLAREVTFRDAIERKEGGMLRRLLLCFSEVLAAEDPHPEWQEEDQPQHQQHQQDKEERKRRRRYQATRLWASKGLADLPGVNVGELKPVISWFQSLPAEARDALLPIHLLRTVVYNQQRPHCCAILCSSSAVSSTSSSFPCSTSIEQQAEIELQGILHDLSIRVASASVLDQMTHNTLHVAGGRGNRGVGEKGEGEEMGGGEDMKRAAWTAEGGWEHVEIWHMFSNSRMDELDYPNKKPSEIVVLEGDVVGSPLLGAELRSLLLELRFRPFPWDVLALSFVLPSGVQKAKHRFKVGTHASALPKEAYVSRRGYVLTHTGASKLTRVWQQYDSVEECFMGEAAAGRIVVLAPGDGRPVIHMSSQDQLRATMRSNLQMSSYHHRGGKGGGRGEERGHSWGEGRNFGGERYPLQERQDPPSPGWTPSV